MKVLIVILIFFTSFSVKGQEISLYDLNKVLKDGKYGDVITIKNGNYSNVNISIAGINNVKIKPRKNGAVVISGTSSINIFNSKSVTLEGFSFNQNKVQELLTIQNSPSCTVNNNYFYSNGSQRYGSVIIFKGQSSNGKVTFNTFDGNKAIGVAVLEGSSNILIKNNKFLNVANVKTVYPKSDGNGMECVQIGRKGNWDSEVTIENNYFKNIIGDRSEIISIKSDRVKVIRNNFFDCSGGVTLRMSNSSIINQNYFSNVSNSIRIHGSNHIIEGNTILGAIIGIQLPAGDNLKNTKNFYKSAYNVSIKRNVVVKTKTPILLGNSSFGRSDLPTQIDFQENSFDRKNWYAENGKAKAFVSGSNKVNVDSVSLMNNFSSGVDW
ncbi:chondroitinase-B domain-containing protein [Sphingobacterium sp. UBA5996]|uniref:chondroitinase-B domain-containing protein n=1 Tax=Sphingobacterium sp. UBA5996 TaxID=1947505 RepID=UPI0025EFC76E|nr:chondroitinase-B domain-containing protein [Sphingobacterium sp. UBA5996]